MNYIPVMTLDNSYHSNGRQFQVQCLNAWGLKLRIDFRWWAIDDNDTDLCVFEVAEDTPLNKIEELLLHNGYPHSNT